ncbi:MAG: hypothetical protein GF393_04285 [Armatimonadia bacterium]|nr:hypothetical protein [Armatimonadia bacterium]
MRRAGRGFLHCGHKTGVTSAPCRGKTPARTHPTAGRANTMRRILVALVALTVPLTTMAEPQMTVDANDLVAHVTPLNGVNCGPYESHGALEGQTLDDEYREMGIPAVRTHDMYGACDFEQIFPSSLHNWTDDPYDHSNYDFTTSDTAVEAIEDMGAEVMFRLGQSWNTDDPRNEHPPDFGVVAHVCKHIAMHYGADEGRVMMWEIWNEPDISMFWDQHPNPGQAMRKFYTLYSICAKQMKSKFPDIMIGGPGMAGGTTTQIMSDARRFARACRIKGAPLDFYSWHSYNRDAGGPYIFAEQAIAVRKALDVEGFPNAVNVLGEWNACNARVEGWRRNLLWNMDGAAFNTAALTYLHEHTDVKYAFRYRGDLHSGDEGYGLVDTSGAIKLPGLAFKAYSGLFPQWLTVMRPEMYRLGVDGGDLNGTTLMATTDEVRRCVNVLVSLYQTGGDGFSLTVENVPQGWDLPRVDHYILTSQQLYEEICQAESYDNSQPFQLAWPGDGQKHSEVHFIRLYDATQFPVSVTPAPMVP